MSFLERHLASALVLSYLLVGGSGCASAPVAAAGVELAPGSGIVGPGSAATIAAAADAAGRFTQADVDFMIHMIPHHAQAVTIAGWCESHGARHDVQTLCEKILISQKDEMRLMRGWLSDRGQEVPDPTALSPATGSAGTAHEMLMPGMLTAAQMAELDSARGSRFDYLFLTGMIGHHAGAIDMVEELFSHPGAGQEATIFRFASDVVADQSAEIDRMNTMLETVPSPR